MSVIALIGSAGVGKTSVLRELDQQGWVCADVDRISAQTLGLGYEDFFTERSQADRLATQYAVLDLLLTDVEAEPATNFALAIPANCLGTVPGDDAGQALAARMKRIPGLVFVELTAELGSLVTRNGLIGSRSSNFVLPRRELRAHLESRRPVWAELSDVTVDTTNLSPAEAAGHVIELLPA